MELGCLELGTAHYTLQVRLKSNQAQKGFHTDPSDSSKNDQTDQQYDYDDFFFCPTIHTRDMLDIDLS